MEDNVTFGKTDCSRVHNDGQMNFVHDCLLCKKQLEVIDDLQCHYHHRHHHHHHKYSTTHIKYWSQRSRSIQIDDSSFPSSARKYSLLIYNHGHCVIECDRDEMFIRQVPVLWAFKLRAIDFHNFFYKFLSILLFTPLFSILNGRCRLFWLNFLFSILFPYSIAFITEKPVITSDHIKFGTYKNESYLELFEGDTLRLNCTSMNSVRWILLNDSDATGFDYKQLTERAEVQAINGNIQSLIIPFVRQYDTGEYTCVDQIVNAKARIYVFVSKREGAAFLNDNPLVVTRDAREQHIDVPCKMTRLITEGVRLVINHIEPPAEFPYDPRYGFYVERALFGNSETPIACKYGEASSEIFIVLTEGSDQAVGLPIIEPSQSWPYVGSSLNLKCIFNVKERYKYSIKWICPNCGQDKDRITEGRQLPKGTFGKVLHINDLMSSDSGRYECQVTNKDDPDRILRGIYDLKVSPTKGQLEVLRVSDKLDYEEGDAISLFHSSRSFPSDEYRSSWKKKYKTMFSPDYDTEVVTGSISNRSADGVHEEWLIIKNASVDDSGIYVLSIKVAQDFFYEKNWAVSIRPRTLQPVIIYKDQYDKQVDPPMLIHSQIVVNCVVKDSAPRTLHLFYSVNGEDWIEVDTVSSIFTHGSSIRWSTVADAPMKLKCLDEGSNRSTSSVLTLTEVSSINATYKVSKPDPLLIEGSNIYEMDHIQLICTLPPNVQFEVFWQRNGIQLSPPHYSVEKIASDFSQKYILVLNRVTVDDSGSYVCVARATGGNETRMTNVVIDVRQVVAPYIVEAEEEFEHFAQYGERTELLCPITGVPEPMYRWLKNGEDYNDYGSLTKKIEFSRVIIEDKAIYTCVAKNRAGLQRVTIRLEIANEPAYVRSTKQWWALGIVTFLVLVMLLVAVMFLVKQRRKSKRQDEQLRALYNQLMGESVRDYILGPTDPKHPLHERVESLPYDRKFEISRDKLSFEKLLGGGQFGQVFLGKLRRARVSDSTAELDTMDVAIKAPRDGRNVNHQKALADELKIMIAIAEHPNVLCLIGAVTKQMSSGTLFVIMEYCEKGNLKDFLSSRSGGFLDEIELAREPMSADGYLTPTRNAAQQAQVYKAELDSQWATQVDNERLCDKMIATSDLISFSYQVANGMEFLANKTCIHRDIAARNILVTKQRVIRIADFGLARKDERIYHISSQNVPLPLKWMALESILNHDFTEESDVWSYGILLWEIFSLGRIPYPDVASGDLVAYLQEGNRMEQPKFAPDDVYNQMRQCWLSDPTSRPTFSECKLAMKRHLERASSPLSERLDRLLLEESEKMSKYGEWRDTEDDEDLRAQATRNGFIAVSTNEFGKRSNEYMSLRKK